jgi:hypothetical protein
MGILMMLFKPKFTMKLFKIAHNYVLIYAINTEFKFENV